MEPIAAAYHWPPETILDLTLDEMRRWHDMAAARLKAQSEATAAHLSGVIAKMFGAK